MPNSFVTPIVHRISQVLKPVHTRFVPVSRSTSSALRRPFHGTHISNMPSKDKYTDPELREQVKQELKEGDKGGAPGQWSARKAQMMASEYKKRGGDYTTDKETGQDESQKNLEKWGDEEWQTKDGEGEARQEDGSRKRYLPKKAWEQMDDKEKEDTESKKQDASKKGQQFVGNTEKAKQSRQKANQEETEKFEQKKDKSNGKGVNGKGGKANGSSSKKDQDNEQDQEDNDDSEEEAEDDEEYEEEDDAESGEDEQMEDPEADEGDKQPKQHAGKKRGRKPKSADSEASKAQKGNSGKSNDKSNGNSSGTHGSKHDSNEAPAKQGSADRLPKKDDRVSWKALPGWVHGKLVEVVTSKKTVAGKDVKGSKEDPRFVLEADSGKTCVHKPEACYYE